MALASLRRLALLERDALAVRARLQVLRVRSRVAGVGVRWQHRTVGVAQQAEVERGGADLAEVSLARVVVAAAELLDQRTVKPSCSNASARARRSSASSPIKLETKTV